MHIEIPEIPPFPDIVFQPYTVPTEINMPPIILSTYGLDCKICGGIVHGSYCASSQEDLRQHIINHPRICHICTPTEN